eukprot:gene9741-11962_t
MNVIVRQETEQDYSETENIVRLAFEKEHSPNEPIEHTLVHNLRNSNEFIPELSIIAVNPDDNNSIVGHVLLTKISIIDDETKKVVANSLALAPVAVKPEYQNKGIGSTLIRYALEKAKGLKYGSVIVLGHKSYYPKFGFTPASKWNIKCPFELQDNGAYMGLELHQDALNNSQGTVKYSSAFDI